MIKESIIFKVAFCVSTLLHFICIGIVYSNSSFIHNFSMGFSPSTSIEISFFRYSPKSPHKASKLLSKEYLPSRELLPTPFNKYIQNPSSHTSTLAGRMGKNKKSSGGSYNEWLDQIRQKLEETASVKYKINRYIVVPITFRIDYTGKPEEIRFLHFTPVPVRKICKEIIHNASPYPLPEDKRYLKEAIKVTFTFKP